jgi:23S rRNA pseudouridine1911/1915/1917 synthase
MTEEVASLRVDGREAGRRLDVFVAHHIPGLSRSQVERLAKSGRILLDGRPVRPGRRVAAGEVVQVSLPQRGPTRLLPEETALDILFEDGHVLVVNKPRGMVVHPGAGRESGTLVNALLAHCRNLAEGSGPHRPGIVHRLDRNTSGLMVIAKSDAAYQDLSRQVRTRQVDRRYHAIAWGEIPEDRLLINVPVGRHSRDRTRMAAVPQPGSGPSARSALTHLRVLERLDRMTLVEASLNTGRTHQIRVHLAHIGHPVVGDPVYGRRRARQEQVGLSADTAARVQALGGQALHAHTLRFRHPLGGQDVSFTAPLPDDMAVLLAHLRGQALSSAKSG